MLICAAVVLAAAVAVASAADVPPATAPSRDRVIVDAKTETVIKGALRYMAAKQTPTGAWTSPNGEHPVAVTGYTLMAFLAAGQLPGQGEYGKEVKRGVDYLLTCAHDDGYISSDDFRLGKHPSNMYDHGIATIALGEIYGQTQDPKVRQAVVNSVKLIVSAQNAEGGWRYTPHPDTADISVTVLQVVALRVAKNGGISVPQPTIDRAVRYVKSCFDANSGGFNYQATGKPQPGFARTAAAIYSLQVCGLYDDPLVARGSEFLSKVFQTDREWFTYGNFYAAPAQYMIGGATWEKWYAAVKAELLNTVVLEPGERSLAYWQGIDANGRKIGSVYTTAVYTMILAMPYHYVPLYQR